MWANIFHPSCFIKKNKNSYLHFAHCIQLPITEAYSKNIITMRDLSSINDGLVVRKKSWVSHKKSVEDTTDLLIFQGNIRYIPQTFYF